MHLDVRQPLTDDEHIAVASEVFTLPPHHGRLTTPITEVRARAFGIGREGVMLTRRGFAGFASELPIEGQPTRMLKPGDTFQVPAATSHAAGKPGAAKSRILITYVVEKGKPLASPA